MKLLGALVFIGIILVSPAYADNAELNRVLNGFDFFGRWAVQCELPASPSNPIRRASIKDGAAYFVESVGSQFTENYYEISNATQATKGILAIEVVLNKSIKQTLLVRREGSLIRTFQNQLSDGTKIVENGIIRASNSSTTWLTKCSD